MVRTAAVIAVFAAIFALAGIWFVSRDTEAGDQFAQCRQGQVAGGTAAIGGPFELVDHNGNTVTDEDVLNVPTLLYFGYTYCPDICPLDVTRNVEAIDLLDEAGKEIQPVFITIDPERDTQEIMQSYVEYMHPRMLGLSGTPEQVKAASQAYRTYYKKQESEHGDDFYLVDHSTFSYLTLPGHGFVEFFRRDLSPEAMAEQIGCFVDNM